MFSNTVRAYKDLNKYVYFIKYFIVYGNVSYSACNTPALSGSLFYSVGDFCFPFIFAVLRFHLVKGDVQNFYCHIHTPYLLQELDRMFQMVSSRLLKMLLPFSYEVSHLHDIQGHVTCLDTLVGFIYYMFCM